MTYDNLITIRDNTFDTRLFSKFLDSLYSYLLMQKLSGEVKCLVVNGGSGAFGYHHNFRITTDTINFNFILYENQGCNKKGYYYLNYNDYKERNIEDLFKDETNQKIKTPAIQKIKMPGKVICKINIYSLDDFVDFIYKYMC